LKVSLNSRLKNKKRLKATIPNVSGIETPSREIKLNKTASKQTVHKIIFNLLFTTNKPLIENSSTIGNIITSRSSFSGVLKIFKSSVSNNGLLYIRYVEIRKKTFNIKIVKKRYIKSK
jgi:hypothetical protein